MLSPTPREWLIDADRRPTFLWDVDTTEDELRVLLRDPDAEVRAYWVGKLLRQAKPDDVFGYVGWEEITAAWPLIEGRLGRQGAFWAWWMRRREQGDR